MPRNTLLALVLAVAGLVVLGGYYLMTRPGPEPESAVVAPPEEPEEPVRPDTAAIEGDEIGPFLAITVAGQANGTITIDLFAQHAPIHVARITQLADDGFYNGVYFHRVIEGFMAQTGDGQFARAEGGDMPRAGTGGSELGDIEAEFSDIPFDRGIVGMARAQDPNSANSQFFIMFDAGHFLNGQYTVVGKVTDGLDVLDAIKLGEGQNGSVVGEPDIMTEVIVTE